MEISYSEFKLYNECPNKYFLTKYIKVPYTDARASFPGTVIQKVMEYFYNDKIYLTNSKVSEWLGTKIVEVHRSLSKYYQLPWVPNEEETLLAEYPLYLNKIVDTIKEHKLLSKIADSEVYIKHPLNELPMAQDLIIGKMDFRITKDDQLWILDGKFSKWGTKYLDQDQLIWYALLEKLKNGKYPTQLGWWLYRQGDIQWIEWNEDRIFELKGRILDAFKDIHSQLEPMGYPRLEDLKDAYSQPETVKNDLSFRARPSSSNCKFCNFTKHCKGWAEWQLEKKLPVETPILDVGVQDVDF